VLGGVAPGVWRAADAASLDDLVAAAIAAYGPPDGADPLAAVSEVVGELEAVGLLEWRR
jgi:hypothetical protein